MSVPIPFANVSAEPRKFAAKMAIDVEVVEWIGVAHVVDSLVRSVAVGAGVPASAVRHRVTREQFIVARRTRLQRALDRALRRRRPEPQAMVVVRAWAYTSTPARRVLDA